MRIAIAAGLGFAATAASAAIVLPLSVPDPIAPRVAALPPPAQEEEPLEVELLRPWPVESEEPPPWEIQAPPQLPVYPIAPEVRDARLVLRLVDDETGRPVAMAVRLWRLGVPEDERWTEGDIEIETVPVDEEGTTLRDLVPGRYRLFADGQRMDAPDPPEFALTSGENAVETRVVVARTIPLFLRVFDEEGRSVERGRIQVLGSGFSRTTRDSPSWARSRCEKLADGGFRGGSGSFLAGRGCNPSPGALVEATAGVRGFELGDWTEERRDGREGWGLRVEFDGRNEVRTGAGGGTGFTGVIVAPALSRERMLLGVVLDDGGTALERGATAEARADALWLRSGESQDLWRAIPVRVKVTLDGYEPLEFEVRADDEETRRVLRRTGSLDE